MARKIILMKNWNFGSKRWRMSENFVKWTQRTHIGQWLRQRATLLWRKRYRTKAHAFNIIKSVVFLITIATYVLIVSGIEPNACFNNISIMLVLASTLLEILSYILRYEEKAMEHWKSAQMYSELYRKCQFFCSMYGDFSLDVWREKLNDISEELSRISLLSPSVSEESYMDWRKIIRKRNIR